MAIGRENNNSVIGPRSIFEGKFYIAGSLRIVGKFEGEIKTDDTLYIGETGKVRTNISAREVTVSGTMIGNIKAENEVRLEETGRLLGDNIAPALHLAKGVVAKGNITITGGQKKDVKKIVEESFGGTRTLDNGKDE
ncbi:cell division protein [Leptospira interrogans]|nr:cell division protein [Leptospira interrogans]